MMMENHGREKAFRAMNLYVNHTRKICMLFLPNFSSWNRKPVNSSHELFEIIRKCG